MQNFFFTVLPDQGIYFIAAKAGNRFAHYPCNTINEMVVKALQFDAQCLDTYFACASFEEKSYIDAKGDRRQRTAVNAGWAKSFWLDLDCGADKAESGKGYATINDALAALLAFVDAVGLPKPYIVSSGGGLHVYWVLNETVTKGQWKPVAEQLKALTKCVQIRLIADDTRTADIASILRPVGTHNYKPDRRGTEVKLIIMGVVTGFDDFSQIISKVYQSYCGGSTRPSKGLQLAKSQSTPDPETPEAVERVKSALAAINPDCEYSEWRDVCFAVHALGWSCSEGLARCWSRGDFI